MPSLLSRWSRPRGVAIDLRQTTKSPKRRQDDAHVAEASYAFPNQAKGEEKNLAEEAASSSSEPAGVARHLGSRKSERNRMMASTARGATPPEIGHLGDGLLGGLVFWERAWRRGSRCKRSRGDGTELDSALGDVAGRKARSWYFLQVPVVAGWLA
ncbi:hypothetical protein BKA81DRAFT_420744 [Phyllosticta paracitricarpa]